MATYTIGQAAYVNKGAYDATANYAALNTVFYHGGTWVALQAVSGVAPGTDSSKWLCITQGIKTLTIAPGATGYMTVTFVLTDGTTSTANIPVNTVGDGTITVAKLAAAFLLPVEKGGTGASTAAGALTNLGAQKAIQSVSGTLTVAGWDAQTLTQDLAVSGLTASSKFIAQPNDKGGFIAAQNATLYPPTAGAGVLTFECAVLPTADIPVTVYFW